MLRSSSVDDSFSIWVTVPAAYDRQPEKLFPVVYVTDGNTSTTVANAALHLHFGDHLRPPHLFIQVTIGYADDAPGMRFARRNRDFIPPGEPVSEAQINHVRASAYARALGDDGMKIFEHYAGNGAADRFLAFIEHELHPEIVRRFRVDSGHAALFGYSQGGMFSLYALARGSSLFSIFGAASPAIMTGKSTIFPLYEALVSETVQQQRRRLLHITINDLEIAGAVPLYRLMGREGLRFIDLVRARPLPGLTLSTAVIIGETHFSGVFDAYRSFLRAFYRAGPPREGSYQPLPAV